MGQIELYKELFFEYEGTGSRSTVSIGRLVARFLS